MPTDAAEIKVVQNPSLALSEPEGTLVVCVESSSEALKVPVGRGEEELTHPTGETVGSFEATTDGSALGILLDESSIVVSEVPLTLGCILEPLGTRRRLGLAVCSLSVSNDGAYDDGT
jgi:hypothetical protein